VLDSSAQDQFVQLTRGWLAAGTGQDEVLDRLRQRGLDKIDCVDVFRAATGMSVGQAKRVVHDSLTWADRREADEYVEDVFWRAAFIECVLGGGQVSEPAEWATECRERQQRAAAHLREVAAALPDEALTGYREAMAGNRLGRSFVALVAAAQQRGMPDRSWSGLAAAADSLCLNELVDNGQPAGDDMDEVRAARLVRQRTSPH
jgi:hypothetical protein